MKLLGTAYASNPLPIGPNMPSSLPSLFFLLLRILLHLQSLHPTTSSTDVSFTFNGFHGANLTLDGTATITSDGLLRLTNATKMLKAHAFFPSPVRFRTSPTSKDIHSFSSTFVFGIQFTEISGHGIVFFLSGSTDFSSATGSQYLGLFNATNNMNSTNRIVGVELDTVQNPEFEDRNNNHVGIDVNGLHSVNSYAAGYFTEDGTFKELSLSSGEPMQVWVDYDGETSRIVVNLAPLGETKPKTPLLSSTIDLSSVIEDTMFLGFAASTDPFQTSHYILGWSYNMSGEAKLDTSSLPSLPPIDRNHLSPIKIWLPITVVLSVTAAAAVIIRYVVHRKKFSDLVEDWEEQYGPHRLPYKTLFDATKGFASSELLGSGGFGSVYRGCLVGSGTEIAVKRISNESRQGIREFVAEIATLGRVRHRNLVPLLGYCRRKRELMLVYEYMPNGSLDKLLFSSNGTKTPLTWQQRLHIIRGVALGLQYLHEEWEQVVIHRDVKASNVLLDRELNGRLGDFGLARLYDHGRDDHTTTHVVGTMGYLAPELSRTSKATKATDMFAFGTFVLEVVSGRRPVELRLKEEAVVLVDWVRDAWRRGAVEEVVDGRIGGGECRDGEVEMVVMLGLMCSHPMAEARPGAREVVRVLEGEVEVPEVARQLLDSSQLERFQDEAFEDMEGILGFSYSSSFATGVLVSADVQSGGSIPSKQRSS